MIAPQNPILGMWELIKAEMDGESAPDELSRRTQLRLTEAEYCVYFDGEVMDRGTIRTVDASRKTLQFHGVDGANCGRTFCGIYQNNGDRLRICFGLDGREPTEFTTAGGQSRYLAMYRRVG